MAQIFSERVNRIPLALAAAAPVALAGLVGFIWYFFSPWYTDVGYRPVQPVAYSHKLHAGDMAIDCRYCHAGVERSAVAGVPPTQVCMNCHRVAMAQSPLLTPIRESSASGFPMRWVRIHEVPDFAYFPHASHVRAGVGCVSCHGRIDQMDVVRLEKPLSMSWCLDCHRNPAPHLRPTDQVTNMRWIAPPNQAEFAKKMIEEKRLKPPVDCSGCHR